MRSAHPSWLETELLRDVQSQLDRWSDEFAGQPEAERKKLLLLALEREQIVAVAYREEAVAGRVAALDVDEEVRALIHQTLVWIWKDEQMHAEYLRGELLRVGDWDPRPWSTAARFRARSRVGLRPPPITACRVQRRSVPARRALLISVAGACGRIPPALRGELRFQTFHRYCELNIALEASAELAYRRLVELTDSDGERRTMERIREDEVRHRDAFALLAEVLTADDRLTSHTESLTSLIKRFSAISPWFIPSALRSGMEGGNARNSFGSRRPVVGGIWSR